MYRFTFSIVLLHSLLAVYFTSQAEVYLGPTDFRVGADVVRPLYYGAYEGAEPQFEFNGSIDFTRLMLVGDYGLGSIKRVGKNTKKNVQSVYTSQGQYFRVGVNYSFLPMTPDRNVAFLGCRYAMSFFKDHLKSRVVYAHSGGGSDIPRSVSNGPKINTKHRKARARWLELVGGMQAKVWASLYAGLTVRYKFSLRVDNAPKHIPYEVLGWGKHDEHGWGINYYLLLQFPIKQFPEAKYLDP